MKKFKGQSLLGEEYLNTIACEISSNNDGI